MWGSKVVYATGMTVACVTYHQALWCHQTLGVAISVVSSWGSKRRGIGAASFTDTSARLMGLQGFSSRYYGGRYLVAAYSSVLGGPKQWPIAWSEYAGVRHLSPKYRVTDNSTWPPAPSLPPPPPPTASASFGRGAGLQALHMPRQISKLDGAASSIDQMRKGATRIFQ